MLDKNAFVKGDRPKDRKGVGKENKQVFKDAYEAAKEGRFDDIPEYLRIRYYNTFKTIHRDNQKVLPSLETLSNVWIWSKESGTGKSRTARESFPDSYIKAADNQWWDGYSNQEVVIIEDWSIYDKCRSDMLKRAVDHYPFPAQIKGSSLMIRPKHIIVTSNYHPEEIWNEDRVTYECIMRRFKVIEKVKDDNLVIAFI